MKFVNTEIAGVVLIESRVFEDARGFFMETFHAKFFVDAGLPGTFVQDNHSRSVAGTLRGMHFQIEHPQGKLVRCIRGEIFDVAVDMRQDSPTLGRWFGCTLSEANRRIADFVKARISKESKVSILGYTDRIGSDDYNRQLSELRVRRTQQYLGIDKAEVHGLGRSALLYDNSLPEGRFYSRTVTVIVTTP